MSETDRELPPSGGNIYCLECKKALIGEAYSGVCQACMLKAGLTIDPDAGTTVSETVASGTKHLPAIPGSPTSTPAQPSAPVESDYMVLEEIGRGGMGVVYRAEQISLKRIVAVKVIQSGLSATDVERRRFRFEAEAAAKLDHPNIVRIFNVGEFKDGLDFFSMQYIENSRSLVDLVKDGPVSARVAADHVRIIAGAVHYAHQLKILHRDLKPSNILIDSKGELHITDFGLAKRISDTSPEYSSEESARGRKSCRDGQNLSASDTLTEDGAIFGTPSFMSPEQARGDTARLDFRCDVYGLGAILYYLITQHPPFQGLSNSSTLTQVRENEPRRLRQWVAGVPSDLEEIALKCLRKRPGDRYQSAQELVDDLGRFLRNEPIKAKPPKALHRTRLWCRRNPLLVLVFIAFLVALWQGQRAEQKASEAASNADRATASALAERKERSNAESANAKLTTVNALLTDSSLRAGALAANADLTGENYQEGLARLAFILRENPTNVAVVYRLIWALVRTPVLLPAFPLLAHSNKVTSAAWSADGMRLVTVSEDMTAGVWDAVTGRPLIAPLVHKNKVRTVLFGPKGAWFITGDDDGILRKWDGLKASPIAEAYHSQDGIESTVLSSDGSRLISIDNRGILRSWDTSTMNPSKWQLPDARDVRSVAFSPDEHLFATATSTGIIQVWDAITSRPLYPALSHENAFSGSPRRSDVKSIAFSPDGRNFVTAAQDGSVRLWEVSSGNLVKQWEHRDIPELERSGQIRPPATGRDAVFQAMFTPDGQMVVSLGNDKSIRFWDVNSGVQKYLLRLNLPADWMAFHPGKSQFISVSQDRLAQLWDWRTGTRLAMPTETGFTPFGAVFSPDGSRLAIYGADSIHNSQGWVSVHNSEPRVLQPYLLRQNGALNHLRFSSDDGRLLGVDDGGPMLWGVGSKNSLWKNSQLYGGHVLDANFNSDETALFARTRAGVVNLFSMETGERYASFGGGIATTSRVSAVCFLPDGKRLLTGEGNGSLCLRSAVDGREIWRTNAYTNFVAQCGFGPQAGWFYTVVTNRRRWTIQFWTCPENRVIGQTINLNEPFFRARLSPSGQRLAVATGRPGDRGAGWVEVFAAPTGEKQLELRHDQSIRAVTWSDDERWIATSYYDNKVKVWDVVTGKAVQLAYRHGNTVMDITFNRESTQVATASADGTARIWDIQSGLPLSPPLPHGGGCFALAWSFDGKWLAVGCRDQHIYLWPVPSVSNTTKNEVVQIAEFLARTRMLPSGQFEEVPLKEATNFFSLQRELAARPLTNEALRWTRWLIEGGKTRSLR